MQARRWRRFIPITSITPGAVGGRADTLQFDARRRERVGQDASNEQGPCNVLVNNVCPGFKAAARLMGLSQLLASKRGIAVSSLSRPPAFHPFPGISGPRN